MRILIIYSTRHGSSEKAANMLKKKLKGDVILHNLKKKVKINFMDFDAIIIGGSIHAGEFSWRAKNFIANNQSILVQKHLGLFLCCMDKEKAQVQFENAYNEELRVKALVCGLFGGEFIVEKMNWFERLAVKKIVGINKSVSDIDEEAIARFANAFNLLPQ